MKQVILATILATFGVGSAQAANLFYKKNSSLYVITNVENNSNSVRLEGAVGEYSADGDAVAFLKGSTLWLIRDVKASYPRAERVDYAVGEFELEDGLIVYKKGSTLHVQPLNASRSIKITAGVGEFRTEDGVVVFLKNTTTLYRVSDLSRSGMYERVTYPVGEIGLSD